MTRTYDVAIVGTGFAGIGMAVRLRAMGMTDFIVLEQAQALGGTWRDNDYPNAACDVPSHLYSFSFEPSPRWSRKFAPQSEILSYLKHVATKFGVLAHIRFASRVTEAVWDEQRSRWTLSLRAVDGSADPVRARVVIAATGPLSQPAEPVIPGRERFRGAAFHTACWDHSVRIDGARVAVIGTGASAIQVVPGIAARVRALKLFQRTPPWIMPKADRAIRPLERNAFERLPITQRFLRALMFWQFESRALGFYVRPELMWFGKLFALLHLRRQVRDPRLRAELTPAYSLGCKRVLLSDDYYPALQRDNVELITRPIREIGERGIITEDGSEHEVDVIIHATGFQVGDLAAPPFRIRGLDGLDLTRLWQSGPEAYLGSAIAGFPNLFFIIGPNSLLGHNSMVHMIEGHIDYIASALALMRARGLASVHVRRDVQDRFNHWVQARMQHTIWATGGCSNRYQTRAGKHVAIWPGSTLAFRRRTARFDHANYDLAYDSGPNQEVQPWHTHP